MENQCTLNKKIRIIILLAVISLFGNLGEAQSVSINFSIEWRHENCYMPIACESDSIPILVIEYINLTDTSFYFQQVGNTSDCDFPRFPVDGIYSSPNTQCRNIYDLAINIKDKHKNRIFSVMISSLFSISEMHQQHSSPNDDISLVYNLLRKLNDCGSLFDDGYNWANGDLSYEKVLFYEKHSNAKPNNSLFRYAIDNMVLLDKYHKNLVFLRPNTTEYRYYNLIGFWYTGGCYTFRLPPNYKSPNFVYGWASVEKIKLPSNINGFSLYNGSFQTNEVTLNNCALP